MRDLHNADMRLVNGGGGFPEDPFYPGPSREEVERQIDQLKELLDEQARRNALPPGP